MATRTDPSAELFELMVERLYQQTMLTAHRRIHQTPEEELSDRKQLLAELAGAIDTARAAPRAPLRDAVLRDRFALSDDQLGFLWLVTALRCHPRLTPHAVTLAGASVTDGATLVLYAAVAELDSERGRALARSLTRAHPLVDAGILVPQTGGLLSPATPFSIPDRVVSFLRGEDDLDPVLAAVGRIIELPEPRRFDALQERALRRLHAGLAAREPVAILIAGPRGSGRRTAVAATLRALDRRAAGLEVRRVARDAIALGSALRALRCECALTGTVPVIADIDEMADTERDSGERMQTLLSFIDRADTTVVVTSTRADIELPLARPVLRVRWSIPDTETRLALWRDALGEQGDGCNLQEVAERYRLGAGGVVTSAEAAVVIAGGGDGRLDTAALVSSVRDNVAASMGALARRVEVQHSWDDVILSSDTLQLVRGVIGRVEHAYRVLQEWGFRRKAQQGAGAAVLFSGPPGTGKSMVAALVAKTLDFELYRVDLSRVVSKWIGETEKNLSLLFDAAEAGHGLLLFDEADALFTKRTQVRDAHDRYGNLEVNYLLQRVETFGGVCILTSNLEASIDPAFKRRLASHIVFWPPDLEERIALWRSFLPKEAPVTRDVDFHKLADRYQKMTGANIRNAALSAAYMAASEGTEITQEILDRAAKGEYRTMGYVL